jgi:glycosyltransferase involved in cell wall biosynthesis
MNATRQPLVTVVMAAYNAGAYLTPAIRCLLAQTYTRLQIIIVDDGSTDGSIDALEDVRDSRIQLHRQQNGGRPAAMNRALDLACGEFYTVLDADDLCHPERVEKQVAALQEHPHVAAVFCGHDIVMDERRLAPIVWAKGPEQCQADIARFTMPGHDPTAMYRMSAVAGLRYDEGLKYVEAYDYVMRVGERLPMMVIPDALYSYRVHVASITRHDPRKRMEMVRVALRRAYERRGLRLPAELAEGAPVTGRLRNRDHDNNLAASFMESVLSLRRCGRRGHAVSTGLSCVALHPTDLHYLKALVYSIAPMWLVARLRSSGSA